MSLKVLYSILILLTLMLALAVTAVSASSHEPGDTGKAVAAQHGASSVYVDSSMVCRAVENRECIGQATTFSAAMGRVYCHSTILGAEKEIVIHHVWYWEDTQVADVPLFVRTPRFRTYSSKKILPNQKGEWRVEITGTNGNIIGRNYFTVN